MEEMHWKGSGIVHCFGKEDKTICFVCLHVE